MDQCPVHWTVALHWVPEVTGILQHSIVHQALVLAQTQRVHWPAGVRLQWRQRVLTKRRQTLLWAAAQTVRYSMGVKLLLDWLGSLAQDHLVTAH